MKDRAWYLLKSELRAQMFLAANSKKLYDGVVENYLKFSPGRGRCIVFNINQEHSRKTCETFLAAGISAAHIDSDTPPLERLQILELFKAGVYRVLCNCQILTEGYDLP